jgi:predicted ATPase/class 3 adenylate cyclase
VGELPSGTVTLLFSDMEGSTGLLTRLGDEYAAVLGAERRLLRATWARFRGKELGTEGDSFYVAFATATDAVGAAVHGQRELSSYAWPAEERVAVRMGVHSGSPIVHEDAYVGMDVHRAARIAGAAHGGQIAVSAATAELVQSSLPQGARLRDLGRHRLKDIPRPEHVFQVVADDLPSEFPRLRSLGAASDLPARGAPLLGREAEVQDLTSLLVEQEERLVTVTGPGGTGKTRLALELAHQLGDRFPDGVYFVPLAAVTETTPAWAAIAEAVHMERAHAEAADLAADLRDHRLLLVLDNVEQLPGAGALATELLGHASRLSLVVTSRRALHVTAEVEYPVAPLRLPAGGSPDEVAGSPAVQLFMRQARRVRPSWQATDEDARAVVDVCRRLDGLPLAIELAAARTKLLSPKAILARLDSFLDLSSRDVDRPSRHRTIRAAVAWSYDLLGPEDQRVFRFLGAFPGGADLRAAAAVCLDDPGEEAAILDPVTDLVDASLVTVRDSDEGPRLSLLETVRGFAADRLDQNGETGLARQRHAQHYAEVAGELGAALADETDFLRTIDRLRREHANFREAIEWALSAEHPPDTEVPAVRLARGICADLAGAWRYRPELEAEALAWLRAIVEPPASEDDPELADCLALASMAAWDAGDGGKAVEWSTRSVDMWRRLRSSGSPASDRRRGLAYALRCARDALGMDDEVRFRTLTEQARQVAEELHDIGQLHRTLWDLAILEEQRGDPNAALQHYDSAIDGANRAGHVMTALVYREWRSRTLVLLGRAAEARGHLDAVLPIILDLGDEIRWPDYADDYAAVLAYVGENEPSARLLSASTAHRDTHG